MNPQLKELDIVLFKKKGSIFNDFIGNAIEWFQWGLGCKSPEYIHVALVTRVSSGLILFQTNPPKAKYTRFESCDISGCTILSRTCDLTEDQLKKSRDWCRNQRGNLYGYSSIFKFASLGFLGRFGPWFRKESREELRKRTPDFNKVCSVLVDDLFYESLGLDILPDIGVGSALPGDMIESNAHKIIKTL